MAFPEHSSIKTNLWEQLHVEGKKPKRIRAKVPLKKRHKNIKDVL
jgi:hypothetical protein